MIEMNDLIDRINDNILTIVEHYGVQLKKRGVSYVGNCPFHNEKTGSFHVSQVKNMCKCFGCQKGGNAIFFIQEQEGLKTRHGQDFIKILQAGAKIMNINWEPKELTDQEKKDRHDKDVAKLIHSKIGDIYKQNLAPGSFAFNYISERIIPEILVEHIPVKAKYDGEVTLIKTKKINLDSAPEMVQKMKMFLDQWGVGYSKEHTLIDKIKVLGFKLDPVADTGIIRNNKRQNVWYDFFSNRLIFPINNQYGETIAFTGRILGKEEKGIPKYKNSPETLIYNKSSVLFGLDIAKKFIKEEQEANIVEGNTDVLRMHWIDVPNTVAAMGTAFTQMHVDLLKDYTTRVNLIYDGDKAGRKALKKTGMLFLNNGFEVNVVILPEGRDPGNFFINKYHYKHTQKTDLVLFIAKEEFEEAADDVRLKQKAIEKIVSIIMPMKELARNLYISELMKISGTKTKEWQTLIIKNKKEADKKKFLSSRNSHFKITDDQKNMLDEYKFYYSSDHKMMFEVKESVVEIGRFTLEPLFHIEYEDGAVQKLFKLKNYKLEERVIETDITALQSPVKLCEKLEEKGNYVFEGGKLELTRLKRWLYDNTKFSKAISVLGWQNAGFWAWADGIIDKQGVFKATDEYGIVEHDNQNYYIPAYSSLNENNNNFVESKKFSYSIQDITIFEWTSKMVEVYGKNAMLSISGVFMALFSDHIFAITKSIPLLNFFGQKGTGKTEHAFSITSLFGNRLKEANINNTSASKLSNHVNDFRNAIVIIDEYKNSLHPAVIEGLKSFFNRQVKGRSKVYNSRIVSDNSQNVNSVVCICGQEMMTADTALFSRAVFLPNYKTERSQEEIKKYQDLKAIEGRGLAHLVSELMKLRLVFEKQFEDEYYQIMKDLKDHLSKTNMQFEVRLIQNHSILLASFRLIEKHTDIAFTYEELFDVSANNIIEHQRLMAKSNEVSGFFKILTYLFERGQIVNDRTFRIQNVLEIGGVKWTEPKKIFMLRWDGIYQLYAEIGKKTGENIMPEESLRFYLENGNFFIKKHKVRFNDIGVRQSLIFDHEKCKNLGLFVERDTNNSEKESGIVAANSVKIIENADGNKIEISEEEIPF